MLKALFPELALFYALKRKEVGEFSDLSTVEAVFAKAIAKNGYVVPLEVSIYETIEEVSYANNFLISSRLKA